MQNWMPAGGNTIRNISNICQNSRLSSSCPSKEFTMNKCFLIIAAALLSVTSCSRTEHVVVLVIGGGASGITGGIQSARMGVPAMVVGPAYPAALRWIPDNLRQTDGSSRQ